MATTAGNDGECSVFGTFELTQIAPIKPPYGDVIRGTHAGLGRFRLGMVQMTVGADKASNLLRAGSLVKKAAMNGAQVVVLPVSSFE